MQIKNLLQRTHPKTLNATVIVNPDSQPVRVRKLLRPALRILKSSGFNLSVHFTKGPNEVTEMARKGIDAGIDAIIVAGGDGTTNEAINAIVGTHIPLGILPFGGSNVLAREIHLPMHPVEAARVIGNRNIRQIDLGVMNGNYFSMMASCGFDAYTVHRTDLRIKKWLHQHAYLFAGLKDFAGYKPAVITANMDDGKVVEKGTFIIISNTHFYGGSYEITPYAEIDDGYFDVVLYSGKYQFGLAHFGLNVLSKQHLTMKNVSYFRAKKVELTSNRSIPVQIDGDPSGATPVIVEVVPKALNIFSN